MGFRTFIVDNYCVVFRSWLSHCSVLLNIAQYFTLLSIVQYFYYSVFHIAHHFIFLKQSAVVRSDPLASGGSCVTSSSIKGRCQWCPQAATKMMMVTSSSSVKGRCQWCPQAARQEQDDDGHLLLLQKRLLPANINRRLPRARWWQSTVWDDHSLSLRFIVHILSVARLGPVWMTCV